MFIGNLICAILLVGLHQTVISKSLIPGDTHEIQADDYDYDADDQGNSNPHIKPAVRNELKPFFIESNITATVLISKDVTIKCDIKNLKDNVILWYKDENVISTGKNLVSPMYSLDPNTHALTIINATKRNQGDYYCEVLPQKIKKHIQLIVIDPELEASIPENFESFKQNSSSRFSISVIFLYLSVLLLGM